MKSPYSTDISYVRYQVSMWRYPSAWFVTVSAYEEEDLVVAISKEHFTIPFGMLKVDDLQHLLGEVYRTVAESTR